jgi:hypothetical protein
MAFSRRGLPGASAVFLSNPPRDLIGGNFIERENPPGLGVNAFIEAIGSLAWRGNRS